MDESKDKRDEAQIYGSFFLSQSEFAINAAFVQEVVNAPPTYTAVPLSPQYLKGLFNLRGMVIPVIDLAVLLHIDARDMSEQRKVAIVEINGTCVGLLFDRTGEVFRDGRGERSDFAVIEDDNVVTGVFKKESGSRIIQILDVTKLFRLRNLPKETNRNRLERENLGRKRGLRKQCISFFVGPAKCALPMSEIQEILKVDKMHDSALGFGHCIGVIDLRGRTVPLIDFASLLHYRPTDRTQTATQGDRRVVVMCLGRELFGLVVDSVDSIISYFPDEWLAFPTLDHERAALFDGCITGHGDADILLLNSQEILTNQEVQAITRGHSQLYQQQISTKADQKQKGGERRTYITFQVDNSFAVEIDEVKEIIEFPKQMLRPPGMQKHIQGVLNLRGDLVTIVDPRALNLASCRTPAVSAPKVLVFKKQSIHFGLVVDSVNAIITCAEKDKIKLPELLYRKDEGNWAGGLSEAVEVTDITGVRMNMLILNVDSVAERLKQC